MVKIELNDAEKSCVRMQCGSKFNERWNEIADTAQEFRSKSCLADYVRGASLTLANDVAIHFVEESKNELLNDVCDLLREMDFFKNEEGFSEACMEEQFRKTLLGIE